MSTNIFFDSERYREESDALHALEVPAGSAVFGIDVASPQKGVEALIAARRAGITSAVYPVLPDPFEQTVALIGQSIAATTDRDTQMDQFIALRIDQLLVNGKKPNALATIPETQMNAAALILRLADVVLLGSMGERDRYNQLLTRFFRRFQLLSIPQVSRASGLDERGVTVYAPGTDAVALAPFVTLLRQRRFDPQIISQSNAREAISNRVVLAPEWRSMRARTVAAAGHHVVTPNPFRVDECDARIFGYHSVDYRSMLGALDSAFAAPDRNERFSISVGDVRRAIEAEVPQLSRGPRASIIVRTYDRPALLERAIRSIAQQTYDNVEIVVVNNGGKDVREVVERAAGGRPFIYEQMPERKHISAASNVGARGATGEYIGYLDDDDLLYADHCARTIEVLERTKANLAFTICVGEYAQMDGDDKHVLGYQIYLDREFHSDDIYISNMTPIHSIVHQRSLFDRFGYFDESLPVTDDWELWLRVWSQGGNFVRIDRATCEYSWRYDPNRGNMTVEHQWDFVRAYEYITSRYANDVAGRQSIHVQQANMLAQQRQRAEDAADPAKRAGIVIGSMSKTIVPVAADWEHALK